MGRRIRKMLVANRGEIAVRIMRTCRDLNIRTVAVFSDPDRSALHVRTADEAFQLTGTRASETYLDQAKILHIAREAGVDAIHPGYGFLSENSEFARAVSAAGIVFVGPTAEAISLLGDKTAARQLARNLGIPTIPGSPSAHTDARDSLMQARKIGFPVLLKAAAGGGGKGMRIVNAEEEFSAAFAVAASEAWNAFGDGRVYVERYLDRPHHVEIQILADGSEAVSLGERDCSVQRRHQKIIEESPCPLIDENVRVKMGEAAVRLAKAAKYSNAGTVEFLVDAERNVHFLEVNTRLQVEHPVTELVTGLDLVAEQIIIAEGENLRLQQGDIRTQGHAIECRVYAEDSRNDFLPSTGVLHTYREPSGPRVRVDSGAQRGDKVEIHYDPLLAKVVTWGCTRVEAIDAMRRALAEFCIGGVHTTIPFCQYVLGAETFLQGKQTTQFINQALLDNYIKSNKGDEELRVVAALSSALLMEASSSRERPALARDGSRWKDRRLDNFQ